MTLHPTASAHPSSSQTASILPTSISKNTEEKRKRGRTGSEFLVLQIDHLLEPKRDDIGTLDGRETLVEEIDILGRSDEVDGLRGVNVPRDVEGTDRSEGTVLWLTQVQLRI